MEAVSSHGTVIRREMDPVGAQGTFTAIGEIGDITPPSLERNEHPTLSHNKDIDSFVMGVLRRQPVTFPMFFNVNDPTHDHLTGLYQAIADNEFGGYTVTQPDGLIWLFSGYVRNIQQSAPVDGVQTANVTIRPSGPMYIGLTGAMVLIGEVAG